MNSYMLMIEKLKELEERYTKEAKELNNEYEKLSKQLSDPNISSSKANEIRDSLNLKAGRFRTMEESFRVAREDTQRSYADELFKPLETALQYVCKELEEVYKKKTGNEAECIILPIGIAKSNKISLRDVTLLIAEELFSMREISSDDFNKLKEDIKENNSAGKVKNKVSGSRRKSGRSL